MDTSLGAADVAAPAKQSVLVFYLKPAERRLLEEIVRDREQLRVGPVRADGGVVAVPVQGSIADPDGRESRVADESRDRGGVAPSATGADGNPDFPVGVGGEMGVVEWRNPGARSGIGASTAASPTTSRPGARRGRREEPRPSKAPAPGSRRIAPSKRITARPARADGSRESPSADEPHRQRSGGPALWARRSRSFSAPSRCSSFVAPLEAAAPASVPVRRAGGVADAHSGRCPHSNVVRKRPSSAYRSAIEGSPMRW